MKVLVPTVVALVSWPAEAWALMVAVGIIHSVWLTSVPTLSYGDALMVVVGISLFASVWTFFKAASSE